MKKEAEKRQNFQKRGKRGKFTKKEAHMRQEEKRGKKRQEAATGQPAIFLDFSVVQKTLFPVKSYWMQNLSSKSDFFTESKNNCLVKNSGQKRKVRQVSRFFSSSNINIY